MKTAFLIILPILLAMASAFPLADSESANITTTLDTNMETTTELRARSGWNVEKHSIPGEDYKLTARGAGLSAISRTPETIQMFFSWGSKDAAHGALTEIHWQEGKNWQLNSMGGVGSFTHINGFITALSRRSDREEVFYLWDNEIKSHHWNGNWHYSGEAHSNKFAGGKIAALANGPNEQELFYVGQSPDGGFIGNSYWIENKTPWTHNKLVEGWEAKAHNKEIVAVRSGNDKHIFWMMTTGEIKSRKWTSKNGWDQGPWFNNANAWGGLAAVSRKAGQVELFWIGKDKKIYHSWLNNGQWASPAKLSDTIVEANIEVVSRHENHMEIFWITPNGAIWHKFWLNGVWTEGPITAGGFCEPQSEITLVSRKSNTIEGWCRSPDWELMHFYYYD